MGEKNSGRLRTEHREAVFPGANGLDLKPTKTWGNSPGGCTNERNGASDESGGQDGIAEESAHFGNCKRSVRSALILCKGEAPPSILRHSFTIHLLFLFHSSSRRRGGRGEDEDQSTKRRPGLHPVFLVKSANEPY